MKSLTGYANLLRRLDDPVTNAEVEAAAAIRALLDEVRELGETREHLESLLRRAQIEREEAQADAWFEGSREHGRLDPDGVIRNPYIPKGD